MSGPWYPGRYRSSPSRTIPKSSSAAGCAGRSCCHRDGAQLKGVGRGVARNAERAFTHPIRARACGHTPGRRRSNGQTDCNRASLPKYGAWSWTASRRFAEPPRSRASLRAMSATAWIRHRGPEQQRTYSAAPRCDLRRSVWATVASSIESSTTFAIPPSEKASHCLSRQPRVTSLGTHSAGKTLHPS